MAERQSAEQSLLITALALRRVVGILGISFPFILALGYPVACDGSGIQGSISAYYHTCMRDVFVGLLGAIGVFLLCYRGYELKDRAAAIVAGIGAVGTALFPVALSAEPDGFEKYRSVLHWIESVAVFSFGFAWLTKGEALLADKT